METLKPRGVEKRPLMDPRSEAHSRDPRSRSETEWLLFLRRSGGSYLSELPLTSPAVTAQQYSSLIG